MKPLKLAITFIAILGVTLGVLWIIGTEVQPPPPPPPDNVFEEMTTQMESDWTQKDDWDKELFLSHCDMLDQLSVDYDVTTLRDFNTHKAAAIVNEKIFDEWKRQQCSKSEVEKYREAVEVIKEEDENAKTDPNVKLVEDVYKTYIDAYNLAKKPIVLRPRFDGSNWNSFDAYSQMVKNAQASMLSNSNYTTYLSNIAEIKNGLDSIPDKLTTARKGFYSSLATEIISYYSSIGTDERTRERLNSLRNVYTKYQSESGTNERLSDFVRRFATDVANNEEARQ